jgi:hypothetical protein
MVDFDIAISATDKEQIEGGLAVIAAVISAGTKGTTKMENSAIARLKFSIPVFFPVQEE